MQKNLRTIEQNPLYQDEFDVEASVYANIGARWSAKTHEILTDRILASLTLPGLGGVIFRHTYASIKDSVYADLLGIISDIGLVKGYHYNATVSPLYIRFANGSYILFKGLDDNEKIKGLSRCHWSFMEEGSECAGDDFDTIFFSIRGKNYPHKHFIASNPVPILPGSDHWLQEKFFNKVEPALNTFDVFDDSQYGKILVCKANYKANLFCPDHIKRALEALKDTNPSLYEMWVLGKFATVEGVILKNWETQKEEPDQRLFQGYGLDFGFSLDPAALSKIWIDPKEKILYAKLLIYHTDLINRDLCAMMTKRGVDKLDKIVADSAEPKSIADIEREGFRRIVGAKKYANHKADMANVLQGWKIVLVDSEHIDSAKRELSTWAWAKDRHGNQLPKPSDGNDHFIDGVIYFMAHYLDNRPVQKAHILNLHA